MKSIHQKKLAEAIGAQDPELAMYTIASSEFPKKGSESVGVIRQYCGTRGKVDNCQSVRGLPGLCGREGPRLRRRPALHAAGMVRSGVRKTRGENRRSRRPQKKDFVDRTSFGQFMIHVVVELTNFPKLDQFG